MRTTEIIRRVCETVRNRRNTPEVIEATIEKLLLNAEPEVRQALRFEIDNAVAAVHRELGNETKNDMRLLSQMETP